MFLSQIMGSYNNNIVPVSLPFKRITIELRWSDGYGSGSKEFDTVQNLAAFLTDNPEFGKAIGYVPKVIKKR